MAFQTVRVVNLPVAASGRCNGINIMGTRHVLLSSLAILAALGFLHPAQCQGWPQKSVKIIVPFAAGGNTGGIAHIIAERLGEVFGRQFIVEHRPGASGVLAAEAAARAPSDGHTLFLGSPSQIAIVPAMQKTSYDPVNDFVPISIIGTNPLVLIVNPSIPSRTVAEFVDYARGQPGVLTYVSSGTGSVSHLSTVLFLKRAGLDLIPVSYKGGAGPLSDVIAGHVKTYFANLSVVLPYSGTDALRLLAVSSEKRVSQLANVPTLNESGFPGFRAFTWNGLMAPAGTPKEIVDRIANEVARAVKDPKIAERLIANGFEPLGNSPEEFSVQITADIALWAEAVKLAGVQNR
jgi:tripartite-type tricarboxylate transporter receptor subunit TctC